VGVNVSVYLENNIKIKYDRRLWTGLIWLSIGNVASACEYCDEPLGFLKRVEFLYYLRSCQRFERVCCME
jgi:hypothetical protein